MFISRGSDVSNHHTFYTLSLTHTHAQVCVWGIFSGIIATILFEMGIGLGWVYGAMGNFIGSAVVPMTMALMWKDCSAIGAIAGDYYYVAVHTSTCMSV